MQFLLGWFAAETRVQVGWKGSGPVDLASIDLLLARALA
jgi:hypothetical protein